MSVRTASERSKNARSKRDQVVLEHLPLVRAIAARVHETLPVHVDMDDLVHAGVLGLFTAVEKYDGSKQVSFQNYAKHRIKGAILDSLRELDWASRDMRRRQKRFENAVRDLANELGRRPLDSEVAARLGVGEERWRQMMRELRFVGATSTTKADESEPPTEFPGRQDWRPDSICERRQLRVVLSSAMKSLPERYRKIVLMYYAGDMSMREIGDSMGINESRVSQLHKSALEKMARALRSEGIYSAAAF
jgi:RNA polymerase sigma factor for flagellar operon FliA